MKTWQRLFTHSNNRPVVKTVMAMAAATMLQAGALADDFNVAPAACQAPFLNQAFPLRWHENYLMNPVSNITTWVVCPIAFDNDTLPEAFIADVIGAIMEGAGAQLPACFLTVHNALNLAQPPYIDGPALKYTLNMPVELLSIDPPIWFAEAPVDTTQILNATGGVPELLAATVFCRLPPGYGISALLGTNEY